MRIRFPDGTQSQGTFGAAETVGDIYTFVKEQLSSPDVPFQLRINPFRMGPLFVRFVTESRVE